MSGRTVVYLDGEIRQRLLKYVYDLAMKMDKSTRGLIKETVTQALDEFLKKKGY